MAALSGRVARMLKAEGLLIRVEMVTRTIQEPWPQTSKQATPEKDVVQDNVQERQAQILNGLCNGKPQSLGAPKSRDD